MRVVCNARQHLIIRPGISGLQKRSQKFSNSSEFMSCDSVLTFLKMAESAANGIVVDARYN